jgi:NAD-dependent dihydropyrimidine dehydrogenase PreA subunit
MPEIKILDKGCRGCTLCVDICPVTVFGFDEAKDLALVERSEDCIGCLSCAYLCPSQCISVSNVELVRPFHRIEENVAFVEQFLQTRTAARSLTEEELETAYNEVGILSTAFAEAVTEILGRGHKSVGRRAGAVAAAHLPEMYEESGMEDLLLRMRARFGSSFDFEHAVSENGAIDLRVNPCGLLKAIRNAGETPGESDLCLLFHEYWVGLISAFSGTPHTYRLLQAGEQCRMTIEPLNQA